jgi:DNA invertase Pin-like site-specific DNA recombinase
MARYHYSRPECEAEPGEVLGRLLAKVAGGDVVEVRNVSDLAYTYPDLRQILNILERKVVSLAPLHTFGNPTDSREQQFKTDLRRAGAMRAKALGRYSRKGRRQCATADDVRTRRANGMRPDDIAADLKISRASVFRKLKGADHILKAA